MSSKLTEKPRKAFTLIELLVVMAIIATMAAMIMPFVSFGQESNDKNRTVVLLNTLATAIDEFVHETGSIPLPSGSFDDPDSGSWYPDENDGPWDKQQLWWRLTHKMTVDEKVEMNTKGVEADLAADGFQSVEYLKTLPSNADREARVAAAMASLEGTYGLNKQYFDTIYRRSKGRSDWYSVYSPTVGEGYFFQHPNCRLTGYGFYQVATLAIKGAIAKDQAQRRRLSHPCIDIEDVLDENFVQDHTIVDAWGNPLIYAGNSYPVMESKQFTYMYDYIEAPKHGRHGMQDRNADGTIDSLDWDVQPPEYDEPYDYNGDLKKENGLTGADTLFQFDRNKDWVMDEKDWASVLYNCLPGRENSFFMASAGPDGAFNVLLNDSVNDDNVLLVDAYYE